MFAIKLPEIIRNLVIGDKIWIKSGRINCKYEWEWNTYDYFDCPVESENIFLVIMHINVYLFE